MSLLAPPLYSPPSAQEEGKAPSSMGLTSGGWARLGMKKTIRIVEKCGLLVLTFSTCCCCIQGPFPPELTETVLNNLIQINFCNSLQKARWPDLEYQIQSCTWNQWSPCQRVTDRTCLELYRGFAPVNPLLKGLCYHWNVLKSIHRGPHFYAFSELCEQILAFSSWIWTSMLYHWSSCLSHLCTAGLTLQSSRPFLDCKPTGSYTISSPGSQTFGLELTYTTSFPGFPASKQQTVRLLYVFLSLCLSACLIYLSIIFYSVSIKPNIVALSEVGQKVIPSDVDVCGLTVPHSHWHWTSQLSDFFFLSLESWGRLFLLWDMSFKVCIYNGYPFHQNCKFGPMYNHFY